MRTAFLIGLVTVAWFGCGGLGQTTPSPPRGSPRIFNGKDLTGWKATGKADQWAAEEGVITLQGRRRRVAAHREGLFGDFELRCEYRWQKKASNSGIALRTPAKGDPAYVGMEIQLIDDEGWSGQARGLPAHRVDLRRAARQAGREQADRRVERGSDRLQGSECND